MSNIVLEINGLSKRYKKIEALKDLSLRVEKGMVFGILGPNGSGKTTTLGILLGVINQTAGNFSWFGKGADDSNRSRIGALLETPNFYPYLDAVRNLRITGKIKGLDNLDERIESVLKTVDLWTRKDSKFKTFSLGMKQRLAIAAALLNDPEILVLDEPTNGLDPQGIAEIRTLIREVSQSGKTIIIASHQLDEIEKVCTDVVILKQGVAIRQSAIGELMKHSRQVFIASENSEHLSSALQKLEGAKLVSQKDGGILVDVPDSMSTVAINRFFFGEGLVLSEIREVKRSLEDQFLEIIKK